MADSKKGTRTTANEIKKLFYTAVRGNMLFIYDNKTKNLLLQSRILPETDPIVTIDRKSTRLNSSHSAKSRMPSSA